MIKKLLYFLLVPLLALGLFASFLSPTLAQKDNSKVKAAAIQGLTKVNGQDVVVEILVAIAPGENPKAAARAALRRAYPDAREIVSQEYSLTGLVWDQFSDSDLGNNYVIANYNPQGTPGNLNNHRNHWLSSMATWTNVTTSSFVYADGGDTSRCPSLVRECPGPQRFDGNNDVGWLNISDPSVLGVTWYGTSTDEFDMALDNQNFSWYTGDPSGIPDNAFDTETVWLHEFGHGLGLGHSNVQGAVMEPYYEGVRRVLRQDDIDGITYLYPGGGSPTPTPTPTSSPSPSPSPSPTPSPSPSPTPTPTPTPTPEPGFSLTASGYKVKGVQHADLSWGGATSINVDVFRNGVLILTTANDSTHTDNIGNRGNGTYIYKLCEAGTSTCSNEATVIFN